MSNHRIRVAVAFGWAALLALFVAGPWLTQGYLFGTDWPGPRRLDFPSDAASSAGLQWVLALVAKVATAEAAGKLLVFGSLFVAAFTAYSVLPAAGFVPRMLASLVYVLNPFVYGRLQYGQLFLLAAYATLPWVALRIQRVLIRPSTGAALACGSSLIVLGVLDLHLLLAAGVLVVGLAAGYLLLHGWSAPILIRLGASLSLAIAVAVVASAYWLVPLATGASTEGGELTYVAQRDLIAYHTVADPNLGLIPNVLGLYGFWAEASGRFTSMKIFAPSWPVALAIILFLATLGAAGALRRSDQRAGRDAWVIGLVLVGAVAAILEIGVADPRIAPIIQWLDTVFPPYRGMRDAEKWAALLALVYSQLVPIGFLAIAGWLRGRAQPGGVSRSLLEAMATGLVIALPIYYGNGLLFGMHGEIRPSEYPAGWYAADRTLASDPHPGQVLFLPWHQYLTLSFVDNANAVVATPAPYFFSIPVVSSKDPELPDLAQPIGDPEQAPISRLVGLAAQASWGHGLADRNIKYVLLAREADWQAYRYLDNQTGLVRVGDYGSIILYRNQLWHEPSGGPIKEAVHVGQQSPHAVPHPIPTCMSAAPLPHSAQSTRPLPTLTGLGPHLTPLSRLPPVLVPIPNPTTPPTAGSPDHYPYNCP